MVKIVIFLMFLRHKFICMDHWYYMSLIRHLWHQNVTPTCDINKYMSLSRDINIWLKYVTLICDSMWYYCVTLICDTMWYYCVTLNVTFICDIHMWHWYVTLICDIDMWHSYVTFICVIHMWHSCVTLICDINLWH